MVMQEYFNLSERVIGWLNLLYILCINIYTAHLCGLIWFLLFSVYIKNLI